jgi:branched-chain amino acid transport system substrate-binding protein
MRKSKVMGVVIAMVCLGVPLLATSQEPPPVKIGFLYPMTGPQAAVGREALRGAQIAADMVNESGGIWNRRKIEFVVGDAHNTDAARTETERLCTVEKVKVILGVYASNLAFIAHPVAHKYGVFFWESNAIAPRLRQMGHKYTFFFGPPAMGYGHNSAQSLVDVIAPALNVAPKDLRVAAVYQGTEWGKSSTGEAFVPKAKELGLNVVLDEAYDPNTLDYTPLVQKIKMARPDVIALQNYVDDGFRFYESARRNGLNPKVWFSQGSVFVEVPDSQEKFGSDMNYFVATNQVPGGNINNLAAHVQAQYRDFLKRYEQKYKQAMASEASIVFTAAIVLFEHILPAGGSEDPDKLAAAAHEISLPYSMTARPAGLKFSSATDNLANQNVRASTMVRQLFNGKFYAVWPKEIAEIKISLPTPPFGKREISNAEVEKRLVVPKNFLAQ